MASEVEIANRALQLVGASSIVSLTENSRDARAINLAYNPVRLAELRSRNWNFAVKTAQLAANPVAPLWGKANSFELPSDFVKLLDPYQGSAGIDSDWQIEGRTIMTDNTAPLNIRYTADITDPNLMDASFREAFSAKLALAICEQITQSNSKMQAIMAVYKDAVTNARLSNALENQPVMPADDIYLTVRR